MSDKVSDERLVEFVVRWAWRDSHITDAERLSAIKYHPTIKRLAAEQGYSAARINDDRCPPHLSERDGWGMKLTMEQVRMAAQCLQLNAAWTTSENSENFKLLSGWEAKGWAERVKPPAGYSGLASFLITNAGRAALSNNGGGNG